MDGRNGRQVRDLDFMDHGLGHERVSAGQHGHQFATNEFSERFVDTPIDAALDAAFELPLPNDALTLPSPRLSSVRGFFRLGHSRWSERYQDSCQIDGFAPQPNESQSRMRRTRMLDARLRSHQLSKPRDNQIGHLLPHQRLHFGPIARADGQPTETP